MNKVALALGLFGLCLIAYSGLRSHSLRPYNANYELLRGEASTIVGDAAAAKSTVMQFESDMRVESEHERSATQPEKTESQTAPYILPAQAELKKANECFLKADNPCAGYVVTSYRDYQVDVLTRMEAIVEAEYAAVLQDSTRLSASHEKFAHDLLASPQPELQLVGIKFLELFAPSKENFDALANCLTLTLSEDIFERGLNLIREKYRSDSKYVGDTLDLLAKQVEYGIDETTSHRAARELFQYLDEQSLSRFEKLEQKMRNSPEERERHAALSSALSEYRKYHK